MRPLPFLVLLLIAPAARAGDRTYFAPSTEVLAGGGFEGLTLAAVGLDATVGRRLSRFLSIEASFVGLADTQPYRLPSEGAECSGESTDQFHWETFGVRLWVRAVHTRHVDFSVAPPAIAGGALFTHERPLVPSVGACAHLKPYDSTNGLFVLDFLRLALELRFDDHFAWRFMAGAELELPLALSVTASAGPVFHF